jgi:hypothetical protein
MPVGVTHWTDRAMARASHPLPGLNKAAGENVTKIDELQKEKLAVIKRYNDEQKQDTDATNAAAKTNTLNAVKAQEEVIRENGRVGLISHAQETPAARPSASKSRRDHDGRADREEPFRGDGRPHSAERRGIHVPGPRYRWRLGRGPHD